MDTEILGQFGHVVFAIIVEASAGPQNHLQTKSTQTPEDLMLLKLAQSLTVGINQSVCYINVTGHPDYREGGSPKAGESKFPFSFETVEKLIELKLNSSCLGISHQNTGNAGKLFSMQKFFSMV